MSLSAYAKPTPARSHFGAGPSDNNTGPDNVRRDDRAPTLRNLSGTPVVVLEPHWQASIDGATD
jgi:hypothetical protein